MYAALRGVVEERRALEVGCGLGASTRVAATAAKSILATDASEPSIRRARQEAPDENVDFCVLNAYELDTLQKGAFDAGYACGFFHLVPQARYDSFLASFHERLRPASPVFTSASHSRTQRAKKRLFRVEGRSDLYMSRTLSDGSAYEIVNNEFDANRLRDVFGPRVTDLEIVVADAYCWVSYRL